jgi:hypothetical protein
MELRLVNNKGRHETAVKVGLGVAAATDLAAGVVGLNYANKLGKSGNVLVKNLGGSLKGRAIKNTAKNLAVVMGIYALYKFAHVPRSGTIVTAYELNGIPKSEELFKFNKGDTNKDIKAKVEEAKTILKGKGAKHIKCKAVFDKSRIAQVKENLMSMVKKRSNSRETLNSRCIEIYS